MRSKFLVLFYSGLYMFVIWTCASVALAEERRVEREFVGCRTLETIEEFIKAFNSRSFGQESKYEDEKLGSGECVIIKADQTVFIDQWGPRPDARVPPRFACMRRRGETTCYWSLVQMLSK